MVGVDLRMQCRSCSNTGGGGSGGRRGGDMGGGTLLRVCGQTLRGRGARSEFGHWGRRQWFVRIPWLQNTKCINFNSDMRGTK